MLVAFLRRYVALLLLTSYQSGCHMQAIVDVVLPVFAIILAGYLAGRFNVLGQDSSEALNRYVYWFALPALFFVSMTRVSLAEGPVFPFIAVYLGGVSLLWAATMAVNRVLFPGPFGALGMAGFVATFANTGYIGIPLLFTAYGDGGTPPAVVASVLNGAVVTGAVLALLAADAPGSAGRAATLVAIARALATNPLLLAPLAGIAWGWAGLGLATPIARFLDLLGASAGPGALFACGLFLASRSLSTLIGGRRSLEVGWLTLLKLIVQPLFAWWLAGLVGLDAFWTGAAVILSALPTGATAFVIATQYQVFVERASATILISTVLAVVSLSIILVLLGPIGP